MDGELPNLISSQKRASLLSIDAASIENISTSSSSSLSNKLQEAAAFHLLSNLISTVTLTSSYKDLEDELLIYLKACKYDAISGENGDDLQRQFLLACVGPEIQRAWAETDFRPDLLREVNRFIPE